MDGRKEYEERFELLMSLLEGWVEQHIMLYKDGKLTEEELRRKWEDMKKKFFPISSRLFQILENGSFCGLAYEGVYEIITEDSLGDFSFDKMVYQILKTYERKITEALEYDNR